MSGQKCSKGGGGCFLAPRRYIPLLGPIHITDHTLQVRLLALQLPSDAKCYQYASDLMFLHKATSNRELLIQSWRASVEVLQGGHSLGLMRRAVL